MKTLIALLLSVGGGSGLAVAAVAGVQAAVNPDSSIEQSSDSTEQINVLDYGTR